MLYEGKNLDNFFLFANRLTIDDAGVGKGQYIPGDTAGSSGFKTDGFVKEKKSWGGTTTV